MYVKFKVSDISDIQKALDEAVMYVSYDAMDGKNLLVEAIFPDNVDLSDFSKYIVSKYGGEQ